MPYYENQSEEKKIWEGYSPNAISKDAQNYLSEHAKSNNPFLLFVSIATPHFPHVSAPEEYKNLYTEEKIQLSPNVTEYMRQRALKELKGYYGHCTATDKVIGELIGKIKELGIWKNTIVVFTSDHGEMMGSHGVHPGAKQLAWDESIRVPFLIHYPDIGGNKGAKINAPINTPDILPSLLGLANIEIPKSIEGEDLSELIKSPNVNIDRAALVMNVCPFATEHNNKEYRGVRTSQYTYVRTPDGPSMMFDNLKDPYQMDNLIEKSEYDSLQKSLDKKLNAALTKIGDKDFKTRDYYLEKWNLRMNNKKTTAVDYSGFLSGEGEMQTPQMRVVKEDVKE